MAQHKVKLLLVGPIGDHIDDFITKLNSLQKSKAGPFDACFSVGRSTKSIKDYSMPLPVYLQDCSMLIGEGTSEPELPEGIRKINTNLFALQGSDSLHIANIWSLPVATTKIVVAAIPPHLRLDSDAARTIQQRLSHVSYVGCDICLSSEFPQGIENLLPSDQAQVGSFDIADIALRARARYHVAPGSCFVQSSPFKHLASSTSTFTPKHFGRFISLAHVDSPQTLKAKGKLGKYIHALGITPLHNMPASELQLIPEDLHPCPYTDISYHIHHEVGSTNKPNSGLSEAVARRLIAESYDDNYRWTRKRDISGFASEHSITDTNTTLFLHGLHKDVSGKLSGDSAIEQAFQRFGAMKVRRPPAATSYAFLEFDSHSSARRCLEQTNGSIEICGVHLCVKWGSQNSFEPSQPKKRRLTEADAIDSSTLYFRLPHNTLSEDIASASEKLRKIMEETLEAALGDPDITAASEPALQVVLRAADATKGYGFLDFGSHAAASMALASRTGSIDGGILTDDSGVNVSEVLLGTVVRWAQHKKQIDENSVMETASGIKFERQHFPADSRIDCWFCLASPTCEKHMITSVHNQCYITMAKGPVHNQGHVLVVPVNHTSQGALSDPSVAFEIDELKVKLRQHASDLWDLDLFVFERAIQTKGGYHTHVQCVPVPKHIGINLRTTMIGMAKACGFNLRELNSDIGLTGMVDEGYFYAELLVQGEVKRFLYRAGDGGTVPLQFGREVLAAVLDRPDLGHWKGCVLSEQDETSYAMKFRESFARYESSP